MAMFITNYPDNFVIEACKKNPKENLNVLSTEKALITLRSKMIECSTDRAVETDFEIFDLPAAVKKYTHYMRVAVESLAELQDALFSEFTFDATK